MSQKPFIWNGNNPLEFSDPSGFDPVTVPRDMQQVWDFAKAASQEFTRLAMDIASLKGVKVVIDEQRVDHTACGCWSQPKAPTNQQTNELQGTIHIQLTSEALQSGSSFAGVAGHELRHADDFGRNAPAAVNGEQPCKTCEGGSQTEAAGYASQHLIDTQVGQYLENHSDIPGPDAPHAPAGSGKPSPNAQNPP